MSIPISKLTPIQTLLVEVAFDNYTYDEYELGGCVRDIIKADDDQAAVLAAESWDVRFKDEHRAEIMAGTGR